MSLGRWLICMPARASTSMNSLAGCAQQYCASTTPDHPSDSIRTLSIRASNAPSHMATQNRVCVEKHPVTSQPEAEQLPTAENGSSANEFNLLAQWLRAGPRLLPLSLEQLRVCALRQPHGDSALDQKRSRDLRESQSQHHRQKRLQLPKLTRGGVCTFCGRW